MTRIAKRLIPAMLISLYATLAPAQTVPPAMEAAYDGFLNTGSFSNIALVRNGNSANNTLGGTHHGDGFYGAEGDDILVGYQGVDSYSFEPGDGADTIIDHSPEGNRIRFREVPEETVEITEVPGFDGETDRLITYADGDAIRIVGWSRLSDETRSGWTIEYFFRPVQEVYQRPHPIMVLLTTPMSLLLIVLCLGVGLIPLVRHFLQKS